MSMGNRLLAAASASLLLGVPAMAHHSQSEFDFRMKVEVEGKVTKVDWRSPHARLYVDVVNQEGVTENWNFELPSPTTLMRRGWTRESIKTGDVVKVVASRARNYPLIAYANNVKDKDGKPYFTGVTEIYEPETTLPKPVAAPGGPGAGATPVGSAKPPAPAAPAAGK